MSPCLSGGGGGGRTFALNLEIVKASPSSTQNSLWSPSSTLSESSNCPVTICTRKPRTQRKRPNQKYNEAAAAALLSTAYPNIFSSKDLISSPKFPSPTEDFFDDSSDLLLPFRVIDKTEFLLHHHHNEPVNNFQETERPFSQSSGCKLSPNISELQSHPMDFFMEDFDAELMLDEEIEEGIIDTIMGDFCVNKDSEMLLGDTTIGNGGNWNMTGFGPGFGRRLELRYGFGLDRGTGGALRNANGTSHANRWGFSTVDIHEISPKFKRPPLSNSAEKKKKKKKVEKPAIELPELPEESPTTKPEPLLKLNFDGVLEAWSDRASPFSDECTGLDSQGSDVYARLAQIDLFSDAGGARETCVLRYKEKRRTRLFCKKIRYQVRKDNTDQCPGNKGRFVRRPSLGSNGKRIRDKKG